ncbi:Collagen triple helix repeat-containing protein [Colletotrichum higginsianum IMI 349063]|uniref:Collagen triple helix repeat-containing protein n=1 Tax=Colletotrichum higginsianum (strain IMI 349063) TaxID=759273 RepID=A0A1B7YEX6_COLHI|nr:Collagen triple helix repeat-containing protein [Colletotrichum higginsianum IMI 349063]OBR10444.1 Collagen triple helix repeat-containing protein [Colletotrichum higginsianum IMI 349063]GJD02543.1 collagen triple helix repeat-containing protein [Colletotrichum higginsianum]
MSKDAILPIHGAVPSEPAPRRSSGRTILISVVTCVLILSLFNYGSVVSTINKGLVVCKGQSHNLEYSDAMANLSEDATETTANAFHHSEVDSNTSNQDSLFLARRNDASPQESTAVSTDGRSGYNRREETDGRSGYNSVTDGRSGYNRREEEDGRSGYNSVTDGRSGYNRREEEDGRSGYNSVTDGRSGYNRREETDGRSGYNSVTDGRSGYNRREEEDGRSGYNSVTDGRSGYNRREETDGRSGYNSVTDGRSGYNRLT